MDEENLSEELEKLIEKKVDNRVEKRLEERLEKSKNNRDKVSDSRNVSRRSFLKKLGAGAIGIGAIGISPSAASFSRLLSRSDEGSGNGLNADLVDGKQSTDLGKSSAKVQSDSIIWSKYAPYLGG